MIRRSVVYLLLGGAAIGYGLVAGQGVSRPAPAPAGYVPQVGDVLFHSAPESRLINAIEGVTQSPYSHCGMVIEYNGQWAVIEAHSGVEITPLARFIARGRNGGFAAYRPAEKYQAVMPEVVQCALQYLGRPYDIRYQLDDERIYCSELVYKAFKDATGDEFGKLARFGDMNWQPYRATIEYINGHVPLDRMMITPKDLAAAYQLTRVFAHNLE
jgi:hypothetical protein